MPVHALAARPCLDSDRYLEARAYWEEGETIRLYFAWPYCMESGALTVRLSGPWPVVVCEAAQREFAVRFEMPEFLSVQ